MNPWKRAEAKEMLHLDKEMAIIEAILFLENEALDIKNLMRISGLSRDAVELALTQLAEHYQAEQHGIELVSSGEAWQFLPKRDLWDHFKERYGKKNEQRLSRAALETLSIIAYSQPVTRSEIDSIRGVSSEATLRILALRNLIQEVGKKDSPGRPVQYGTTREFLKLFRLNSIADLPKLNELERERFELN
jgi:segregation and condensation protein B